MNFKKSVPDVPPKPVPRPSVDDQNRHYNNISPGTFRSGGESRNSIPNWECSISQTLDNSLILDQQLETLNYHKKVLEARKMQELLREDPVYYQNHLHHHQQQQQRDSHPVVYSHIMYDQYPGGEYRLGGGPVQTTDLDEDDVSSSYSELTRTVNNNNAQMYANGGVATAIKDPSAMTEVQKRVQLIQQHQQKLLGNAPVPAPIYHKYSSVQAGMHPPPPTAPSTYSNYESIYEPINPRPHPHHQFQLGGGGPYSPAGGSSIYYGSTGGGRSEHEVDALTDLLVKSLHTNNVDSGGSSGSHGGVGRSPSQQGMGTHSSSGGGYDNLPDLSGDNFGNCVKCGGRIIGENAGCTAMDQIFHIECFTCSRCQINLQGKPFYPIDNQPFCEEDYLNTLEKCSVCLQPILERILRATGKPYHPQCFTCIVCSKSLDGIPFTVDATNQIYCIEDFHKKFAPRCCVCHAPIMPEPGKEETVRVVALDRSFHITCYKCEDCGLLLSSESEGRGCYPLDDHVLCKSCNAKRVQNMTTEL